MFAKHGTFVIVDKLYFGVGSCCSMALLLLFHFFLADKYNIFIDGIADWIRQADDVKHIGQAVVSYAPRKGYLF